MTTDTREALAALMVIAAECAQRKPLRGFEELTEATHIGHRQFGRAHEQADEDVRMLAVRLRAVFDTLAAALATQPAQPSATPSGYNRPPNGEPLHPEEWSAGYEQGFADAKASQPSAQGEAVAHPFKPVTRVMQTGSYKGVPAFGCILPLDCKLRTGDPLYDQATLDAALAASSRRPEQAESVAHVTRIGAGGYSVWWDATPPPAGTKLYTAAPAAPAQAVPLTTEQVQDLAKYAGLDWQRGYIVDDIHNRYEDFARAIERAHGIKAAPNTPTK